MTNETIKTIQKECLEGIISVADAISQINTVIGGITRADFKEGCKFKLTNHNAMFALDVEGFKKRELDRLHGMAVIAYFKAQKNGSICPGEVHISGYASTKHHMGGIHAIQQKYALEAS